MADFSGLQSVTNTVRQILLNRMSEAGALTDVLANRLDSDNFPTGPWVNVFLYRVSENAELKNQDLPGATGPLSLGHPPLSVDLHYLITAEGSDADDGRAAQRVLGDAMLTLHDHPIIPKDDPLLDPGLQNEVEHLTLTLETPQLESLTNLWTAASSPFRLSAAYKVTVVQLESQRQRSFPKPVLEPPAAGPRVDAVPIDRPIIERIAVVRPPSTDESPVAYARIGDVLVIHGTSIRPGTRPMLGDVDASANVAADSTSSAMRVAVPDDPALGPGVQRLQLVRDVEVGTPPRDLPLMRSQVAAFVLVPAIAALSATDGVLGTTVTITGTRLTSDGGPTLVVVGDRPLQPEPGATDTQLDVVITGVAVGVHPMSVRVNGAESIDRVDFEVTP